MATPPLPRKLWEHPNPESTRMWKFILKANDSYGLGMKTFDDLYEWSVGSNRTDFWDLLWKEIDLIHEGSYSKVVDVNARMDSIPKWFEGIRLNYAENMLYTRGSESTGQRTTFEKEDDKVVVTQVREGATEIQDFTWGELRRRVGLLSNAMRARGVRKGDRVGLVASNSMDTLTVFLATTTIGAIFGSSSTDMGTKGILDRLVQIRPTWVFMDDGAVYNGKTIDLRPKISDIIQGLAGIQEFQGLVTLPRFTYAKDVAWIPKCFTLGKFLEAGNGNNELRFERTEYSEPFLIVWSSGTTGMPKAIVHSVGGVLTSAGKEGRLHRDLDSSLVGLQYTTTGWIMYLSAVSPLLFAGRSVLYDGSPFLPDLHTLIKLAAEQKVTNLGVSPRYFHELQKNGFSPRDHYDLSALQSVTSTGMVLKDSLFEWVYDEGFPPHIHLCNISGGTDIAGTFGMENPLTPLFVGGCQGPSIGTAVETYDQTLEGGPGVKGVRLEDGIPGELVATKSFPNMPVKLWGSDGMEKYYKSYFARFDDVWVHGDFVMRLKETGQIFFLGRADGVLNPSGVRFGSAEIYSVIESQFPEVADSVCVGQRRPNDNDETVLLFLLMAPGQEFNQSLVKRVQDKISTSLSKRHVPKHVFPTEAIPQTINGKKVELPVKQIVSGMKIKPSSTLANPQSLDYYYQFAELKDKEKAKL